VSFFHTDWQLVHGEKLSLQAIPSYRPTDSRPIFLSNLIMWTKEIPPPHDRHLLVGKFRGGSDTRSSPFQSSLRPLFHTAIPRRVRSHKSSAPFNRPPPLLSASFHVCGVPELTLDSHSLLKSSVVPRSVCLVKLVLGVRGLDTPFMILKRPNDLLLILCLQVLLVTVDVY